MLAAPIADWYSMSYTKLVVSRDAVLAAGEALRRRDPVTGEFVDLSPEELRATREVLDNWRAAHNLPLVTFRMNLQNHVKRVAGTAGIVAQRLKREESIQHKLRRFDWITLPMMQDIGGLRAIVSSVEQVRRIRDRYLASQSKSKRHSFDHQDDYLDVKPKPSGYRGIHLIYCYNDPESSWHGLKVEIQLRTRIQHEWATANEIVGYGRGEKFKSGEGDPRWLRMFTLIGAALAHVEETKPIATSRKTNGEIPESLTELVREIAELDKELKFIDTVSGYGLGFKEVSNAPALKGAKLFLLRLDLEKHQLNVTAYMERDVKKAEAALAKAEAARSATIDVCLVSVQQIKNLKKAYPNYYMDTGLFLARVLGLLKLAQ